MDSNTTQRAYTLRLKGADRNDDTWQDRLWQTHLAVNRGAKAFGDWLLTLRGGLSHELAELPDKEGNLPDVETRNKRRDILALSWLTVESVEGAPTQHIVAGPKDPDRMNKLLAALQDILKKRGLRDPDIESWVKDCKPTLDAAIREDAVWVNRSAAFDEAASHLKKRLTRNDIWDLLGAFFPSEAAYLQPVRLKGDDNDTGTAEERTKDLVQKASQWLSSRFGPGEGADFARMTRVYELMAEWAEQGQSSGSAPVATLARHVSTGLADGGDTADALKYLVRISSYPGHSPNPVHRVLEANAALSATQLEQLARVAGKRAESCRAKVGAKGLRQYACLLLHEAEVAAGFSYRTDEDGKSVAATDYASYGDDYKWGPSRHVEFSVMLDHAARRVSALHTWVKRAEATRAALDADAARLDKVPAPAREWLERYCTERSLTSGSIAGYRIRRRAIDGWDDVVRAWSKPDCKDEEARIAEVHRLQDELDKFGDAALYQALAADDALHVWQPEGKPDPEPLKDFVRGHDALDRQSRYKVPRYCHPDPLLHPVWCDFGCSRWTVEFEARKAAEALTKTAEKLPPADSDPADEKATRAAARATKAHARAVEAFGEACAGRALTMTLWDGGSLTPTGLRWQSKRLAGDLGLADNPLDGTPVSRADRLARAAAGVGTSDPVRILSVYKEKHWNARLQAPRPELERLDRRVKLHDWDPVAEKMRRNLHWHVTFSARLQEQEGPWHRYRLNEIQSGRGAAFSHTTAKGVEVHASWPHSKSNKDRKELARLDLCRLPGLRVLGVDLGHRYAAACAVWETIPEKQFEAELDNARNTGATVTYDPGRHTDEDAVFCHVKWPEKESNRITKKMRKDGRTRKYKPTRVYRRTGPDMWARLVRQFLVKLQGEERPTRKAGPKEIAWVEGLEKSLGCTPPEKRDLHVDELMSYAVRLLRLGLRRHADRARIAYSLKTDVKLTPGGGTKELDSAGRAELVADLLLLWHSLAHSTRWPDPWAKEQWDGFIAPRLSAPLPEVSEDAPARTRRKVQTALRDKLKPVAQELAADPEARARLHTLWKARWMTDDAGMPVLLRELREWLLPRGAKAKDPAIRHVGGLSLDRLAAIRGLWQVLKAWRTRPEPDELRKNVPARDDHALDKYGQRILDALERMREQRVKQLASRIAEAALGIGSEDRKKHWEDQKRRPRKRIADPRFAPCHAVIIENLQNYRPDQVRSRQENRNLMTWSAHNVRKFLAEACQLHGLHLREVPANYTSRQDSRTGAPGWRCRDLTAADFVRWAKAAEARWRKNQHKDPEAAFLLGLYEEWKDKNDAALKAGRVRVPDRAGELFVSADPSSPLSKGIQADLNAAANIGLRALLDPDWPGRWWWIPCDGKTAKPARDKTKGSAALNPDESLIPDWQGRTKDVVNLWRDVSAKPVAAGGWRSYHDYWDDVRSRVVARLQEQRSGLDRVPY